ncbi:MAG: ATP-binding cassette domain-containing protein [Proteobacteria bacterium]|nr:ATP-binding cassette domain-containing protein [Pseudomonadota bacterium]
MAETLLEARDLYKYFPVTSGIVLRRTRGWVQAVDGVNFKIGVGETLGVVGESGCGKTTTAKLVLAQEQPTSGSIEFRGQSVANLRRNDLKDYRKSVQIVFQDPYSALNPRKRIGKLIDELLMLHTDLSKRDRGAKVLEIAENVHLNADLLTRFPNEISGGQLQRVCIARAIATEPKLIVLDEPTSSLDLSVRSGILELLEELQRNIGVAMLFISHDLDTVRLISDRIIVLYLGSIVEYGSSEDVFTNPVHPYTQSLLSANLSPDPDDHLSRFKLTGEVPSPLNLPAGCPFAARCPLVLPECRVSKPPMQDVNGSAHGGACIRIADGSNILT